MCAQVSNSALRQRNKNAIEVKVTLLGLNRLTASLGLALHNFSNQNNASVVFYVLGRDENKEVMKEAQKQGFIDNFHLGLREALAEADIVFLNMPMSQQPELFAQMGPLLKSGAVIVDLSPFKQMGVKLAAQHFPKDIEGDPQIHLVGATPLVSFQGIYNADMGIETANADLFKGGDIIIAPHPKASQEAVKVVTDLAEFLEMKPRFSDPMEHDALMTLMEAVPSLLSTFLIQTIIQSPGKRDLMRSISSSFAVALNPLHNKVTDDLVALWSPNRDSLVRHIDQLMQALQTVRGYLTQQDPALLRAYIDQVLNVFTEWEIRRQDNKWEEPSLDVPVAIQTGFMSRMFFGGRKKQDES